ncbi:piercer of microtubule wall 2 protein [Clarias gariepinus]|uniref:piercer of microtubule wall 1 protein n=1 Tax=Clarias gariepinus TaxID=13013 RepID=UPI00234C69BC|nr:piercer of microtubule wall 1 protein [Clarias gariepinus]
MDAEGPDAGKDMGKDMEQDQPGDNRDLRTSDVYRVDENLPKRFNNPDHFKGYSKKSHPLYQTTNQLYGSKKPTVHEMPTSFHGSRSKFSDLILKTGTYRDNGFNTSVEKSWITGPNDLSMRQDRIIFHHSYHTGGNDQT